MNESLEQFQVKPLVKIEIGGVDFSFTNASLWMGLTVLAVACFFAIATNRPTLKPGRMQMIAEMLFGITSNMLQNNVGSEGRRFFPLILTLFLMVLFGNLFGLFPGAFTFTSHIAVTFFMASVVFISVTVIGFFRHGIGYLKLFLPEGVPIILSPIIILIELLSYLARPVSLSIRLFANMVVGHVLMKVFAHFVIALGIFGFVPLFGLVSILALEFLVAVLQAYIFAILTCVYLSDAINLH